MIPPPSPEPAPPRVRLASIDAFRGFVLLLLMAEALALCAVAQALPESGFFGLACRQQSHAEWVGCSLHDLIQPGFTFLVGASLPFSLAARTARGESFQRMLAHAAWRSLAFVALGVFLTSVGAPRTQFAFADALAQIGLGYLPLFLLAFASVRAQWLAFAALLVGSWAAFALYPLPGAEFDYAAVGVLPAWLDAHGLAGFAAHWQKNSNLAWAFDVWFLNLFPRDEPFTHHGGGYATASFVPTLATMLLGLVAGNALRGGRPRRGRVPRFALLGVCGLLLGAALDAFGLCPIVKRVWTPSFVLWSGGCCLLLLAAFYATIDIAGRRAWAFPLRVIGMNSIAAYALCMLAPGFVSGGLTTHLGSDLFAVAGAPYEVTAARERHGRDLLGDPVLDVPA
jgi:predicted acyltransferase